MTLAAIIALPFIGYGVFMWWWLKPRIKGADMKLDPIAVKAATEAIMDNSGCTWDGLCDTCRDTSSVAINAYFASLEARGMLETGIGWRKYRGNRKGWQAESNVKASGLPSQFPVTIIRTEPLT